MSGPSSVTAVPMTGDQMMMELFGGRTEFEALPVLDIQQRKGSTGYIDFIEPQELGSPIMRGHDCYGREFFVVRAKSVITGNLRCQAFFQREPKSGPYVKAAIESSQAWTDGFKEGDYIVSCQRHIVDHEGYEERPAYAKLRELITTGKLGDDFVLA